MPRLIFTDSYEKRARRFLRRHPDILGAYQKTLELLELNPRHPSLRLHKLRGRLSEYYSVSINMSCRICIDLTMEQDTVIPVSVGTHDEIY